MCPDAFSSKFSVEYFENLTTETVFIMYSYCLFVHKTKVTIKREKFQHWKFKYKQGDMKFSDIVIWQVHLFIFP